MNPQESSQNSDVVDNQFQHKIALAIYGIHIGAVLISVWVPFLALLLVIVAVVLGYLKRKEVTDGMLRSHYDWQINTFWGLIIVNVAGVLLGLVVAAVGGAIGWLTGSLGWAEDSGLFAGLLAGLLGGSILSTLISLVLYVWWIYRVAKGLLKFNENKPV